MTATESHIDDILSIVQTQYPEYPQLRNYEKTLQLRRDERYSRYTSWLDSFGAIYPTVQSNQLEFPVAFGPDGLVGVAAKEAIPPNSPMVFVPFALCITYAKAKESELKTMMEDNPKVFSEEEDDWVDYAVYAFLIRERIKDTSSFFYPYFQVVEHPEMLMDWSNQELKELHDQFLYHKVRCIAGPVFSGEDEEEVERTGTSIDPLPRPVSPICVTCIQRPRVSFLLGV